MSETKIPLAGVIGNPISHSRSPLIHGHWLKKYGIKGFYVPMHVEHDDLETVLRSLPKLGFRGINVTIPHKVSVLGIADIVTDRATLIGAANTLTFTAEGKIHADNTDGYGFIASLKQGAPSWDPKSGPALVFGAGGASRAVICSLLDAGVPEIILTNRTRHNADMLKSEFGARVRVVEWVQAGNVVEDAGTIVNTTSLGMSGKTEFRVPLDGLRSDTVVTDIVYEPLETTLLKTAKEAGCVTVDGLGMLLHQAAPGFERWFGKMPEVDDETRRVALS
ncbi:shikimate dehydrogenase [Marivivens sp. LCG002]|uniref:shikimate dehydrogenase n=1 Tax=Marivivens sp. LCG002 TaxID=3051171 RepID=UPI00255298BE|nr:shikimate dehydrogenase [Marivivens sp. LCG002]WIV50793.1 shikimate dehydrogenase [Marivivens sp. LCG002]